MKENQPLYILVLGILAIILAVISLNPSTQETLAGLLSDSYFVNLSTSSPSNSGIEYGVVSRVVDGDTVVLTDGRDIRYLYIDTPETVKPGTPVECYGPESKRVNQRLVEGMEVVLLSDKEREDQYGRDLRIIFIEGTDYTDISRSINAQLVMRGYAKAKAYSPNTTYQDEFENFEEQARQKQLGLWSACEL